MEQKYKLAIAKDYLNDKRYDLAVEGAAGVVLGRVESILGNDMQVKKRTNEEPRPTRMTRQAISDIRDRGLITPDDEKEALWLIGFYDRLKVTTMPSENEARRAITVAERFDRLQA